MKRWTFLIVSLTLTFTSCASMFPNYNYDSSRDTNEQTSNKKTLATNPRLYEESDDFSEGVLIKHSYYDSAFSAPVNMYIFNHGSYYSINIVFRYSGRDWIFFDSATFINSDGKKIDYKFDKLKKFDKVLDGSSISVYESYTFNPDRDQIRELRTLLLGKNIRMRLWGQGVKDFEIDRESQFAMLELMDEYYRHTGF